MQIKERKGLGRLDGAGVAVTDKEYALYKTGEYWFKKYLYDNDGTTSVSLMKADDLAILSDGTIVYCSDGQVKTQ